MTDPVAQSSTFERSCQHWSVQGQAGMDAFYRLAAVDYQLLAKQLQWAQVFTQIQNRFGDTVRLLDVACGSGQFPTALLENGGLEACPTLKVQYSLLDPSQFSIDVAGQKLRAPFEPAEQWLCTAQELPTPNVPYPVVWATHALYCVPPDELELALDRMLAAMDPQGLGFIAHASHAAHYLQFHDLYLQTAWAGESLPYCKGEQVIELLSAKLDASQLQYWAIDYEGTLGLDERETVELYLQRCLFDDSISLEQMLDTEPLDSYLHSCMDESSGMWRFNQKTWLIFYGELAQHVTEWRGQ
jgi:SAM-dependent methyltransferase